MPLPRRRFQRAPARRVRRRLAAFLALFGTLAAGEVYGLFVRETGVPRVDRGPDARLVGEIAGPAIVAQTFSVGVDGLDGITVEARPFGDAVAGTVVFDVAQIDPLDPRLAASLQVTPLYRILHPARDVVRASRHRVGFPPIAGSRGRLYRLEVRVPDAPPGQGLGLWATRGQAYRGGVLVVNGREVWGDLVFQASAGRATAFGDLQQRLRAWHPAAGSPWLLGALLVLYNSGLAVVVWFFVGGGGSAPAWSGRDGANGAPASSGGGAAQAGPAGGRTSPGVPPGRMGEPGGRSAAAARARAAEPGRADTGVPPMPAAPATPETTVRAGGEARSRRPLVVSAIVVAAGVAGVSTWRPAPEALEPGALDLLAGFPDAEKRTTLPSLEEGFDIQTVTIGGERRRSLFAPPFSRVIWTVQVPERAVLRTAAALRPDAWQHPTDGALFRVGVADEDTYTEFFNRLVRPHDEPGDRRWVPVDVDLSAYAGRTVKVIFNTEPGPQGDSFADACLWGAPRLVSRDARAGQPGRR